MNDDHLLAKGTRYVIPILQGVAAAADAFPPLKSAASGALFIFDTAQVLLCTWWCIISLVELASIFPKELQIQSRRVECIRHIRATGCCGSCGCRAHHCF